jgi:uncharacterized lipoprotein YmbA
MNGYAQVKPLVILIAAGLAACASTPPSSFYTLVALPAPKGEATRALAQSPAIGVGPISFPSFLDRDQMVSRSGDTGLNVDELHRWGGSLEDDFRRVLGEDLAQLLGTSRVLLYSGELRYPVDYRVAVDVLRFEGTAQSEAVLKVRWALLAPDAQGQDPAAMVQAMSRTLGAFSRDLAEAIRAQSGRKPSSPPER